MTFSLSTLLCTLQRGARPLLALLCALAAPLPALAAWGAANWTMDADNEVLALARQSSNGKIWVGGKFTTINGQGRAFLARFSDDGSLDASLPISLDGSVYAIAAQPDGKILVGGVFTGFLTRLNSDGTLDSTFTPPAMNGAVVAIAVQSDGDIVMGGAFTLVGGAAHQRVARLNTDGSVDSAFANPSINNTVLALSLDGSGGVYAGGLFTQVSGAGPAYLVRLDGNGAKVGGFNPVLDGQVHTLQPVSAGLLVGGNFTQASGSAHQSLVRLDSGTGAADPAYTLQGNSSVQAFAVAADGRLWTGGGFLTLGGVGRERLALLDASGGALDSTFPSVSFGSGAAIVQDVLALPDGSVVVAGGFAELGGQPHTNLARLANLPSAPVATVAPGPGQVTVTITGQPDAGAGVANYGVACSSVPPGSGAQLSVPAGSLPQEVVVPGLVAGTAYQCAAIAYTQQGTGPQWTAPSTVTPTAAPTGGTGGGSGTILPVPAMSPSALVALSLALLSLVAARGYKRASGR